MRLGRRSRRRAETGPAKSPSAKRRFREDCDAEVCEAVGGFRHGEVVKDPDGDEHVCVGVREDAGLPQLFFAPRGSREAGVRRG